MRKSSARPRQFLNRRGATAMDFPTGVEIRVAGEKSSDTVTFQ